MPTAVTGRPGSGVSEINRLPLPAELLEAIRRFETCTIADAIERRGVRLRNEGFTRPGLSSFTAGAPRAIGYAATYRVKSSAPPVTGGCFLERADLWAPPESLPAPRIAVIQDLEREPVGSVAGEVHVAILQAFGCQAVLTNGPVRDLPGVNGLGVPVFGRCAAVSHAYTHLLDRGTPVEIFGLQIRPGDLVLADCHGAVSIPVEIAPDLPAIASRIRAEERRIIDFCRSEEFSAERLLELTHTRGPV